MISKEVSKLHCALFVKVQDRLWVMFGGEGARINYFAVDSHEDVKEFDSGHAPRVKCMSAVEVEGTPYLLSASSNGTIKLWNLSQIMDEESPGPMIEQDCDLRITCMTVSTI
jgi:WD40 repeat protein